MLNVHLEHVTVCIVQSPHGYTVRTDRYFYCVKHKQANQVVNY